MHLPRCIAQEQCSSPGGFAGQHGRSDHRMGLLTVVEAVTLIECSLRLNRHLQHRAASERAVSRSTGKHGALSLWNGLGGDLDGLSELEGVAMHKAELRRKCTPQAASHRLLRCAQQLAVAVGAAAARTTRYRCSAG